jgi:hypothetical protein
VVVLKIGAAMALCLRSLRGVRATFAIPPPAPVESTDAAQTATLLRA